MRAKVVDTERVVAIRTFTQQFQSARTQALSAVTRVKLASSGIGDARQSVEVALARYRTGEASIFEVIEAQNALVGARLTLYQAIYDYQTEKARLVQTSGEKP